MEPLDQALTDLSLTGLRVFRDLLDEFASEHSEGEDMTLTIREVIVLIDRTLARVPAATT